MASYLEGWRSVANDPQVVKFFAGLFERLGVEIGEQEQFTCHHRGDRIEFEDGLNTEQVDYSVKIEPAQAERVAEEARRGGGFDDAEAFRITRTLFTPATAAIMAHNPVLSNSVVRQLTGAEDVIHVRLHSPSPDEPDAAHTLTYADGRWQVQPGLHGEAARTFTLSTEAALDYQRRVFAAVKANNFLGWLSFGLWYRGWRKKVSVKGAESKAA
jgi:hypothetical protein